MLRELRKYPWTLAAAVLGIWFYAAGPGIRGPEVPLAVTGWTGTVISEPSASDQGLWSFSMQVQSWTGSPGPRGVDLRISGWKGPGPVLGQVWSVQGRVLAGEGGLRGRISRLMSWTWADEGARIRHGLRQGFFQVLDTLPPRSGALGKALLLGNTDDLTPREKLAFRESGTSHILALSGMHLGIFALMLNLTLGWILSRKAALGLTAVILTFFVWMAGPIPSLVRALVMYYLVMIHLLGGRRLKFLEILSQSFLVCAALWPQGARTLSMELSFLALGGMALFAPVLDRCWRPVLTPVLSPALAAGVGAAVGTLPLTSALFGVYHPEGLLISLPLELITTALIYLVLGYGLVGVILPGLDLSWVHPLAEGLYDLTLGPCTWGLALPGISGWPLAGVMAGVGLFLGGFFFYKRRYDPQLRFPHRHKELPPAPGHEPPKTLGPKFPHQRHRPEKNPGRLGTGPGPAGLGGGARSRRHDPHDPSGRTPPNGV